MFIVANFRIATWSGSELPGADLSPRLVEAVQKANHTAEPLRIRGSGSKFFYGRAISGTVLDVSGHQGIVSYEPSELVMTARAGTKLSEIVGTLAESRQILGFEPPWFGSDATLGGTIACGFSGPRRPFAGAARDFVLGVKCINGKGEFLSFGGKVIKNVAGYDVSRLMVGALGTLGVLCEISLKVVPVSEVEITRTLELDLESSQQEMVRLSGKSLPLSAASYVDGLMRIRLSGTENGVRAAEMVIGGESDPNGPLYWEQLREHKLMFFNRNQSLWRISVPANTPTLNIEGDWLVDWGGAQRWIYTHLLPDAIFEMAKSTGGYATMFRPESVWPGERFSSLSKPLTRIHSRLKTAFDPGNILNAGIMYEHIQLSHEHRQS